VALFAVGERSCKPGIEQSGRSERIDSDADCTDSTDLRRQVDSISAQNQQSEAFRRCPECGAEHFTQSTSRGGQPG
jgi:hypothetical protein